MKPGDFVVPAKIHSIDTKIWFRVKCTKCVGLDEQGWFSDKYYCIEDHPRNLDAPWYLLCIGFTPLIMWF